MIRPSVRFSSCLVLTSAVWCQLVGCGGPAAPKREYADVTGKVTYKEKPVGKGSVIFQPASGGAEIGELKEDGTYSLKGVVGSNTVTIGHPAPPPPPAVTDDFKANKAAQMEAEKAAKAARIVPDQYTTPAGGLKFDVKPGTNKADFDLK